MAGFRKFLKIWGKFSSSRINNGTPWLQSRGGCQSEKYGYDENYGYGTSYYEFYVGGPVPEEVLRDQEKEMKSSSERKLREFWLENEECKKRQKGQLAKIDIEINKKNNVVFKDKEKLNEKDEYEKFDFFIELNKLIFSIENGKEYKKINPSYIFDRKE